MKIYIDKMCFKSFLLISILFMLNNNCFGNIQKKNDVVVFNRNVLVENSRFQPYRITFSDSWIGKDKADHFLVSAFLTAGCFYFLTEEQNFKKQNAIQGSIGFSFSIGLAKEIRDGFLNGRAGSVKDFVADVFGIGVALLLYSGL